MKALPSLLQGSRRRPLLRLAAAGLLRGATSFAVVAVVAHTGPPGGNGGLMTAVWLLSAAALLSALRGIETLEAERLGQAYVRALRRRMFENLIAAGNAGLNGFSRGSLWVRLTGDLNGLRRWVSLGVSRAISAAPMLAVLTVALMWLDVRLAGLVVAAVAATGLVAARTQAQLLAREAALRRARARLAGPVEQLLSDLAKSGTPNGSSERLPRLKLRSRAVADASVDRARSHACVRAMAEFAPLAVTAVAVALVATQERAAMLPALALAGLLAGPLRELALAWEMLQGYRVAAANVRRILDLEPGDLASPLVSPLPSLRLANPGT